MAAAGSPRFCHLCGQQLSGRYYRYGDALVVCASCHKSSLRCAHCNLPLAPTAAATNPSGGALCPACARTALQCACCGSAIVGVWYAFEETVPAAAQRRFCARCVQTRPRCDLCRAPVTPGASPLMDGQYRCTVCAADMLLDDVAARVAYGHATRLFAQVVGAPLRALPRLDMVSRRRMGAIRRYYERAPLGTRDAAEKPSYHVLGYFVRAGGGTTIYVEVGLPRPLLTGTLAHELGHAWQAENAPELRDPLLCEGFAEWVAHRVLVAANLAMMAARATRRDDTYGQGLRLYLKTEHANGLSGVLALARGEVSHAPRAAASSTRVAPHAASIFRRAAPIASPPRQGDEGKASG